MPRISGWREVSRNSKRYTKWVFKPYDRIIGRASISKLRNEWFVVVKTADKYISKPFDTFIEALAFTRKEMTKISREMVGR